MYFVQDLGACSGIKLSLLRAFCKFFLMKREQKEKLGAVFSQYPEIELVYLYGQFTM
jgi:hypothetical protein